ncbi:GGDEF domain-containing protein [Vibrio genomosp. F10]|nr:sensor domain-containing diguanylate cyclase [Vibrio genomosp. F10]OEF04319.1 diguanylate cyclase [Vibrio genomosp. F10 str. 9ZB36]
MINQLHSQAAYMIDMQREEWLYLILRELPDRHSIVTQAGEVIEDFHSKHAHSKGLSDLVPPQVADQLQQAIALAISTRTTQSLQYAISPCQQLQLSIEELDTLEESGERWIKAHLTPIESPNGEWVVIWKQNDITQEYLYQTELKRLSETDELTNTLNRRAFFIELEQAMQSSEVALSCLMVDIDHFKEINDKVGHLSGDNAIVQVAKICQSNLPPNSKIGRLGGEEFCVLIKGKSAIEAYEIAENIREAISQTPCHVDEHIIYMTVSIGITEKQHVQSTVRDLLIEADKAMYYSKQTGRDQVTIYHSSLPKITTKNSLNVKILRAS